ncbi:carboxypeptidase-like regulatory domain-containing protein [Conexibacter sp. CPCC 206217]|uniref:carboxypeptidase-like regulatory domain-containing protein n=1 Tax=Conexibacter sp. CPCC 206217 TaxID=3064574 RepID=UPI00271FC437|nr:carboxypeptidase-like regulatory domain-containing protein [Conexibacter sp. CPCC 206217]MDO8208942.1 carboxypeptidase-like regulatory domain-containing protein [Conexibacter sp. CPCC 206217]
MAYSCHTPSGRWASTEGWTGSIVSTNPGAARTYEDCQQSGQPNPSGNLVAELREPPSLPDYARAGDYAAWGVGGPDGTLIQDARVGLCARANAITGSRVSIGPLISWISPGMTVLFPRAELDGWLGCGGDPWWRSDPQTGGRNYIDLNGLNSERLYFTSWCGVEDCNPGHDPYVRVEIAAAQLRLRDEQAPTVDRAAGSLANGVPENGRLSATFDAHDVGGGIYRAIVDVKVHQSGDWRQFTAEIVDRVGGRCAPAGETGDLHEFLYPKPCADAVADAQVSLDTSQLPVGDHLVRAQIEDAAGNRTDIVPARIIHIDAPDPGRPLGIVEPPAPNNGQGASTKALVRLARESRTVRYRAKLDIRGRLVDEHDRPIAGAKLQVDSRRLIPRRGPRGASWTPLGKVTTDRAGRFTARIPTTTSRVLRFSYKANLAQDGFTSAAQFGVSVRAHVAIRAKRSSVRNGQAAVFVGRVLSTPRGGVPLSLQAWVAGRGWTPARTEQPSPRTGLRGRFRVAYRFARTYSRVVYRFRLVVGEDSNFPFVQTASRRMKVVVRP